MFCGVLKGKNILLRLVEVSDAQFIYEMRQGSKSKHLSKVVQLNQFYLFMILLFINLDLKKSHF